MITHERRSAKVCRKCGGEFDISARYCEECDELDVVELEQAWKKHRRQLAGVGPHRCLRSDARRRASSRNVAEGMATLPSRRVAAVCYSRLNVTNR